MNILKINEIIRKNERMKEQRKELKYYQKKKIKK